MLANISSRDIGKTDDIYGGSKPPPYKLIYNPTATDNPCACGEITLDFYYR